MKKIKLFLFSVCCFSVTFSQEKDSVEAKKIEEVVLTAERKSQLNKLNVKKIEVPITTQTINLETIEKRNVTTLESALKSTTGVRVQNIYGGFTQIIIRGFSDYAFLVDGVRDERTTIFASPMTNLANIQSIEVLKGPESILYGHSVLGGIVNIIRKKPTKTLKGEAKIDFGSYNFYGSTVGVGGPISNKVRFRFDFGTTKTDGWRNIAENTNNGSAILEYIPNEKDFFQLSAQITNDKFDTDTGVPADPSFLGEVRLWDGVKRETRYGDPSDFLSHKRYDYQLKYVRKTNEKLQISNIASYSDDQIKYVSNDGGLSILANDPSKLQRTSLGFNRYAKSIQNQIEVNYKFEIGSMKNTILAGNFLGFLNEISDRVKISGPGKTTIIDVVNPKINQGYRDYLVDRLRIRNENILSYYLQNWLDISDKIKVFAGGRFDSFTSRYYYDFLDTTGKVTSSQPLGNGTLNTFTYRMGAVFSPLKNMSFYGSYSTYFKPTRKFGVDEKPLDPEDGFQAEVGTKIQYGNRFFMTLAGFYIKKNNIAEAAAGNTNRRLGDAESKGVELDFNATPINGFSIRGGYTYTHAKNKNSLDPKTTGTRLRYAPEHQFNYWMDYKIQDGFFKNLGLGVGAYYESNTTTYTPYAYTLPAYFTADGTVYYTFKNIRLGLNVNNITNTEYYSSSVPNFDSPNAFPPLLVTPAMGRNYKISIGYKF